MTLERNRLTTLLVFFLFAVVVMLFINERIIKLHFTTNPSCLQERHLFSVRSEGFQTRELDKDIILEIEDIQEKIRKVNLDTSVVEVQLREARERVNKLELKLYESEKRLKIFQGPDKPVPPRNGSYPNFIIMGTWKGGTTSLHKMLQNHPNICLALGEVNFFSRPTLRNIGLNLYYKFFERCLGDPKRQHKKANKGSNITYSSRDDIVVGEKSPTYLWNCKTVCPQIKKVNPNVKLIVSLRNPIDRAFSNWYMDWCKGVFNGTFEEFLNRSSKSLEAGIYIHQMRVLHQYFPREQIFAIKTEDFFQRPRDTIDKLEKFLGVSHYTFTDEEIRTYGSSPKCQKRFGSRPGVNVELLPRLLDYFKEPNAQLEEFMRNEYGWGPLGWDQVNSLKSPPGTEEESHDAPPKGDGEEDDEDEDEEISEDTEDNDEEVAPLAPEV